MRNHTNESGFTIVEVLTTSLIFSIIGLSISAIFIQTINLERRGFAIQKIQDNAFLALEEMSRDIRVSRILNQDSPDCSANILTLTHPLKGTVAYQTSNGVVQRSVGGESYVDVSTSNVNFTRMNFCILGSLANDNQSPLISIITSVQNRTGKDLVQINLQTTVISRNFADEFQNP